MTIARNSLPRLGDRAGADRLSRYEGIVQPLYELPDDGLRARADIITCGDALPVVGTLTGRSEGNSQTRH
jgi:hypothetical protein